MKPTDQASRTVVASVQFSDEQRKSLESATGLSGLTGVSLVDLGKEDRDRLSPSLVRGTVAVLCW